MIHHWGKGISLIEGAGETRKKIFRKVKEGGMDGWGEGGRDGGRDGWMGGGREGGRWMDGRTMHET